MASGTVSGRNVVADFGGGTITSNAGALQLGATDQAIGLTERFARCFTDARTPHLVEHTFVPWCSSAWRVLRWDTRIWSITSISGTIRFW